MKLVPAEVFWVGEYLCEEMEARGWTTGDVALRMGGRTAYDIGLDQLSFELLLCAQDEQVAVTDGIFAKLDKAFGVSAGFFSRLHEPWVTYPDRRSRFSGPDDTIFGPARAALKATP